MMIMIIFHQSGDIGEDPLGIPNNLMPYIAQVMMMIMMMITNNFMPRLTSSRWPSGGASRSLCTGTITTPGTAPGTGTTCT